MAGRFGTQSSNTTLKPMLLSAKSAASTADNDFYDPLITDSDAILTADANLKRRIRRLKLVSRLSAVLLSLATLVPLILTIVKFLQTRDTYYNVNGVQRTAWAKGTVTWYTYLYTAVAGVSLILNVVVVGSYVWGVRRANQAAKVEGWWSWGVMGMHVVVWAVGVGIYRRGREANEEGRFVDLWGWTCSPAARELQGVLTGVDFDEYCAIQTTSFYTGIANVVAGLLSIVIMAMAHMRKKSKRRVSRAVTSKAGDTDLEPLRS